jgi:three-Cys-motif partner protein
MAFEFDKIGYWSELKLEILGKYDAAYTKVFASPKYSYLYPIYIDAFAGAGKHISKTTNNIVRGSPQIALDTTPPFKEYFFIDTNGDKVNELQKIVSKYPQAKTHIIQNDCNSALLKDILPMFKNDRNKRGLCILDPYGLDLKWEVIETAGKLRGVEIFLNFPVMDMRRNVLLYDPNNADIKDIKRMDSFWGSHVWKDIAYTQTTDLFGEIVNQKQNIKTVTSAFREQLAKIANFTFVPEPIPMRNSRRGLLYFIFFASNNKTGNKIVTDIFKKYRDRGLC